MENSILDPGHDAAYKNVQGGGVTSQLYDYSPGDNYTSTQRWNAGGRVKLDR